MPDTSRRSSLSTRKKVCDEKTIEHQGCLADDLACDMMNLDDGRTRLMLLIQEISFHPFNNSHVETIANLMMTYLFAYTREANAAFNRLMNAERAKLQNGGSE